jgi:hypothetical protein
MNIPELIATALNASSPVEKRRAAYAVLEKMGIDGLPISANQRMELVWAYVLDLETSEQYHERFERQEKARIAKEDSEFRHCSECFWKVPVAAAVEGCPKCTGTSWILPASLSNEEKSSGRPPWQYPEEDEKHLRMRLKCGNSDITETRRGMETIIRIMKARGYSVPPPPYGAWPYQFYLTDQEAPLITPRVPTSPGSGMAVYQNPADTDEFSNLPVW